MRSCNAVSIDPNSNTCEFKSIQWDTDYPTIVGFDASAVDPMYTWITGNTGNLDFSVLSNPTKYNSMYDHSYVVSDGNNGVVSSSNNWASSDNVTDTCRLQCAMSNTCKGVITDGNTCKMLNDQIIAQRPTISNTPTGWRMYTKSLPSHVTEPDGSAIGHRTIKSAMGRFRSREFQQDSHV
jgi:hypothetical protein